MTWETQNEAAIEAARKGGTRQCGMTFVCSLPDGMGKVIKMRIKGDRVVCETESGATFIAPRLPK